MYSKNCPCCDVEMFYENKNSLYGSILRGSRCKSCASELMSKKSKGVVKSEEHKLKLSEAKIGIKLSEEHKVNIGNSIRGLKRSDESKLKLSESKIGDKNPAKRIEVREKIKNSIIKLYEDHPEVKNKISKSLTVYFQNSLDFIDIDQIDGYIKYKREVKNLTIRNKKKLFENWKGFDYYDNEFILNNKKLHYNDELYPTIDHKISILSGFKNKYPIDIISGVDNLCITKRILNTKKGAFTTSEEFKKLF